MRILYLDIDTLRPDHLGCYGYHRTTSPNLDRLAAQALRFNNCYVSDAPCLPSRTALWSGRAGIHTGVINHGGVASEPFMEGRERGFRSAWGNSSWMHCLRQRGMHTATISPFGERHSAWHWYANFSEIHNTGRTGNEVADEISPLAIDWIQRNARRDNWFLHVNVWDPHTPYRTPESWGNPFANDPLPAWLTEEIRQQHWNGCGPHSAREVLGFGSDPNWERAAARFPRQPVAIDSMDKVRMMFDGYDCGIRYADEHVGRVLNALADAGVMDDTAIIVSSDHGENLGEFNIYGDHQTADHCTSRVPLLMRWPGVTRPGVEDGLIYAMDWAATSVELTGGQVPPTWDGQSFAAALKTGDRVGRDYLVVSQGAWSCQRSVRFDDYLCMRSYHDGYHAFPDVMLFNVKQDPHEQYDLAEKNPDLTRRALSLLEDWHAQMMRTATHGQDPMWTVLSEGGPLHTRGALPAYLTRLRQTDRAHWAEILERQHAREARVT